MSRFREGRRVNVDAAFDTDNSPVQNGDYLVVTAAPTKFEIPAIAEVEATPKLAFVVENTTGGAVVLTSPVANAFVEGITEGTTLSVAAGAAVTVWYDDAAGATGYLKVQK